jgi:pimeloyl-ACP methyl ester carboxylesterase
MRAVIQRWIPRMCDGTFVRASDPPAGEFDLWCLHGLGEWGLVFAAAFDSGLTRFCRVLVPDLPGCGASLPQAGPATLESWSAEAKRLIGAVSLGRPVALLGHSVGGMVVTDVAAALGSQVRFVIDVEGNLTDSDAYFSGLALRHASAGAYHQELLERVRSEMTSGEPGSEQYRAALVCADPETLWGLGRSVAAHSTAAKAGADFARLAVPKSYYYGTRSLSAESQAYLDAEAIPAQAFAGLGHWLMLEAPGRFYAAVEADLRRTA